MFLCDGNGKRLQGNIFEIFSVFFSTHFVFFYNYRKPFFHLIVLFSIPGSGPEKERRNVFIHSEDRTRKGRVK